MVRSTDRDDTDLLLHAYLDGELDVTASLRVKQRIDTDPTLAKQAANIQALKEVLRENFAMEAPPSYLAAQVSNLDHHSGLKSRPTWQSLAAAVVIGVALSSTSTWLAQRVLMPSVLTEALVDGHLRSLMAQQGTDVTSSDRHTVKPWFAGKVAQSPRVKDLSASGFPLVGGRIDVLQKAAVPTLVYNRRRHVISITAAPLPAAGPKEESINGFTVLRWSDGGMSYWAISDLNPAELHEFVLQYRAPP